MMYLPDDHVKELISLLRTIRNICVNGDDDIPDDDLGNLNAMKTSFATNKFTDDLRFIVDHYLKPSQLSKYQFREFIDWHDGTMKNDPNLIANGQFFLQEKMLIATGEALIEWRHLRNWFDLYAVSDMSTGDED